MLAQTKNLKNTFQNFLYRELNIFAHSYPNFARFTALPISLFNASLDLLAIPISILENLALAAINLVGAAFHLNKCSYRDADTCLKRFGNEINTAPFLVVTLPLEVCLKTLMILAKPTEAKRNFFNFLSATLRPARDA